MENDTLSYEISRNDVVYTLMKVSQLDSTSSSSLDHSASAIDKTVDGEKSCGTMNNLDTQLTIPENKYPMNSIINIKINLSKKINEKLLQIQWNNYIHWKTLFSFGLGLWIALCIADKHYRKDFSSLKAKKNSKIIETTVNPNIIENIVAKSVVDESHSKWFYNYFSNISLINKIPNMTEACILSCFMVLMIFVEYRIRKISAKKKSEDLCTQCQCDFTRPKSFDDKYYKDELTMNKVRHKKERYMYDNEIGSVPISKKRPNAVKLVPYDRLHVNPDIFWELKIIENHNHHPAPANIKRNDNKHLNKFGMEGNVVTNIDSSSWNNNSIYNNGDWTTNLQNFHSSNCNCSLSYPNYNDPLESINVNSTYDTEIHKFILSKHNSSTTEFEDITADWQKYKSNNVRRRKNSLSDYTKNPDDLSDDDDGNQSSINTIKYNKDKNNHIISSSPAFKKFLSELKNNPTPFKTHSWIYN